MMTRHSRGSALACRQAPVEPGYGRRESSSPIANGRI